MAMALRDAADSLAGWKAEIIGIDLSATAIAAAEAGTYNQFDVQRGLPVAKLLTYFTKRDDHWVINPGVGGMIEFKTWNLLEDLYPLGQFDVVLCRNVLVYFDLKTKFDVLQKISRVLADDGVLYLGLDDAVSGVSDKFRAAVPEQGIFAVLRSGRPASSSLAVKGL
jgi:chemotaxis protein methyltransferase CheR